MRPERDHPKCTNHNPPTNRWVVLIGDGKAKCNKCGYVFLASYPRR